MNLEEQQKYVEAVAEVIKNKILSMKNINKSVIDVNNINSLAYKSACDLLTINLICYEEFGLFDESLKAFSLLEESKRSGYFN